MSARLKLIMEEAGQQVIVRMPAAHGDAEDAQLQSALSEICITHKCDAGVLHSSGVDELLLWCKDAERLSEVTAALVTSGWRIERLHEDHARLLHHGI